MIVVPAPLETTVESFENTIRRLTPFYKRFQVDIADGTFVPNKTVQIADISHLSSLVQRGTIFDFHLMVQDPISHIEMIKELKGIALGTVLIHSSVFPSFKLLVSRYPLLRFGLVLSPDDLVKTIDSALIKQLPSLQVMTVQPGFQGSSFIEDMLTKIEQLRKGGFMGEILIDGSVNEKTIPSILSCPYKPDVLGIGSYLTKAPPADLPRRVEYLKQAIHHLSITVDSTE